MSASALRSHKKLLQVRIALAFRQLRLTAIEKELLTTNTNPRAPIERQILPTNPQPLLPSPRIVQPPLRLSRKSVLVASLEGSMG